LSQYGEPVLETKKVRDFLNRIHAPELPTAKQQVKATPMLLANFQEAANFIPLSVIPIQATMKNVAAMDTETPFPPGKPSAFDTIPQKTSPVHFPNLSN
jgi:hypothetical protein